MVSLPIQEMVWTTKISFLFLMEATHILKGHQEVDLHQTEEIWSKCVKAQMAHLGLLTIQEATAIIEMDSILICSTLWLHLAKWRVLCQWRPPRKRKSSRDLMSMTILKEAHKEKPSRHPCNSISWLSQTRWKSHRQDRYFFRIKKTLKSHRIKSFCPSISKTLLVKNQKEKNAKLN